MVLKIVEV